jgi:hypothetical protein
VGCCTTNPCENQEICPIANLRAANRTTFSTSSALAGLPVATSASSSKSPSGAPTASTAATAQSLGWHDLAPGAVASIAIGACGLLLALGIGVFLVVFIRRRKHAKLSARIKSAFQPDSLTSATTRLEQMRPGSKFVFLFLDNVPNRFAELPFGPEPIQPSAVVSPVGTVMHSSSLSQPITSITPLGHTQSLSHPSTFMGHSRNTAFPTSSAHREIQAAPAPSHQPPQNIVIIELDSKHTAVAVLEPHSTPIAAPSRDQGPPPPPNTPFVVNNFAKEVQEKQVEGEAKGPIHFEGSASGPGWDDWNGQTGFTVTSRPPPSACSQSQGPSRLQSQVQNQNQNLRQGLGQVQEQAKEQSENEKEDKEQEEPLSPLRNRKHETVYVAYRPSHSQCPSPSQHPPLLRVPFQEGRRVASG